MKIIPLILLLVNVAIAQDGRAHVDLFAHLAISDTMVVTPNAFTFSPDSTNYLETVIDGVRYPPGMNPYKRAMFVWLVSTWDAYAKECYEDSVAERGFWFTMGYPDSAVSESYPGPKWWRPWDSMGEFLESAYRTRAVIRYVHPNAVPPDPFIEYLRKRK